MSRERWKTFNRKCAISRASVLDFTVMHLGGGESCMPRYSIVNMSCGAVSGVHQLPRNSPVI